MMWLQDILLHLEQQPALSFLKVGLKRGMKYRWGAVWIARYSEAFRDGGWWLVLPK